MLHKFLLLVVILSSITTYSQQLNTNNTVGLLYTDPESVSEGALLYAPLYSKNVFLIDNCGALINQWYFDSHSNYSGANLLEDGSVIKLVLSDEDGGAYGRNACIEKRSWDNTLLWKFCGEGRHAALHSDYYVLPNGNVLSLLEDRHSFEKAILAGAKVENFNGNTFDLESVVEIKPTGTFTGEIVWEWHLWDHLIQDNDSTKINFGDIKEYPRRMNINLLESSVHFNSIDYNIKLNQIMLSNWSDHEIYIIDHTTTSETAATSEGGKYGYGGDFLFRWGNDRNFNVGRQALFGQHNPSWIPLSYGRFSGMISVFNNQYGHYKGEEPKSAVVILNIDPDGDGIYDFLEKNTFEPSTYEYIWMGKIYDDWMLSDIMSGIEVQPNGNLIVCEATKGRFSEIDTEGNIVWIYKCPDEGTKSSLTSARGIIEQGNTANSQVYKIKKYPPGYAPLQNIELCKSEPVENINKITGQCVEGKMAFISFDIKDNRGSIVVFEAETNATDSLIWNFGDGQQSMENNPTHQYNAPGDYEVCLTGYNCFGSVEKCMSIEIIDEVINTLQYEELLIKIIPNPAKTHIKVIANDIVYSKKASIYSIDGQLIKEQQTNKLVDVSSLQSGVYIVKFENPLKRDFEVLKFIKIN